MNRLQTKSNGLIILILGMLTAIGPLSMDIYLHGLLFNETILPMVTVMLVFCLTGFTLLIIGQNRLKKLNAATA